MSDIENVLIPMRLRGLSIYDCQHKQLKIAVAGHELYFRSGRALRRERLIRGIWWEDG